MATITSASASSAATTTKSAASTTSACYGPPWICGFGNFGSGSPYASAYASSAQASASSSASAAIAAASSSQLAASSSMALVASSASAAALSAAAASVSGAAGTLTTLATQTRSSDSSSPASSTIVSSSTLGAPLPASESTASSSTAGQSNGLSAGVGAGIGIGCFLGLALLSLLAFLFWRKHKQRHNPKLILSELPGAGKHQPGATSGSSIPSSDYPPTASTNRSYANYPSNKSELEHPETPVSPLTPAVARFTRHPLPIAHHDPIPSPITTTTALRPQSAQLLDGMPVNELPTERQYAELKATGEFGELHPAYQIYEHKS